MSVDLAPLCRESERNGYLLLGEFTDLLGGCDPTAKQTNMHDATGGY